MTTCYFLNVLIASVWLLSWSQLRSLWPISTHFPNITFSALGTWNTRFWTQSHLALLPTSRCHQLQSTWCQYVRRSLELTLLPASLPNPRSLVSAKSSSKVHDKVLRAYFPIISSPDIKVHWNVALIISIQYFTLLNMIILFLN